MEPTRFVALSAAGVLTWITRAQRSRERDLVEHLVARDADQAIDVQVMARHLEISAAELGQILFALNRSNGIRVSVAPPPPTSQQARCLGGLQEDLKDLAGNGQQALLLGRDGLCISAVGWSVSRASQLAAAHPSGPHAPEVRATLFFAREAVSVLASTEIDPGHPAWVGLARRLLPACGAMACRGAART
jgi:hypothetical protein